MEQAGFFHGAQNRSCQKMPDDLPPESAGRKSAIPAKKCKDFFNNGVQAGLHEPIYGNIKLNF